MSGSFSSPLVEQSPEMTEQVALDTHSTSELLWQGMWSGATCASVGKAAGGAGAGVVPCVSICIHIFFCIDNTK